jgi:DNA processing protein
VQGCRDAQAFARALSERGICIISGLALGIDAAAHRGGLAAAGSTIAVLGSGSDVIYPRANTPLFAAIQASGLLVSEFPPGTPPSASNFPRRNRLISGLAMGCLVVEAARSSGSLITARLAADQGREVFAIPGSIHAPMSKGCHELIRHGAKLVETAEDVLSELRLDASPRGDLAAAAPSKAASSTHGRLLHEMGFEPIDIESLSSRAREPIQQIHAALLELELSGEVASLPGGLFQRLS